MLCSRGLGRLPRVKVLESLRRSSSASDTKAVKPYLVTTPIFYPTASPHIGHLYTLILSDILKRWQVLCGWKALLNTGTDEHGKKVWEAAERAGLPVKAFCKERSHMFKVCMCSVNVSRLSS